MAVFLFELMADLLGGVFGSVGDSDEARARHAYKAAWKRREEAPQLDALYAEMKRRNVPGIYSRTESDPRIVAYAEAWAQGVTPPDLKKRRRRRRS